MADDQFTLRPISWRSVNWSPTSTPSNSRASSPTPSPWTTSAWSPGKWLHAIRRLMPILVNPFCITPTFNDLIELQIYLRPYEGNMVPGLQNMQFIRTFVKAPGSMTKTHIAAMSRYYYGPTTLLEKSQYTSDLLFYSVCDLCNHATTPLRQEKGRTRIEEDVYSEGVALDVQIAVPNNNGQIMEYIAAVIRERETPDVLTSGELYAILSLASKFRDQQTHTSEIKVRLFVVFSRWVQVLSITAPLSYILSVVEGHRWIDGDVDIHHSPWFDLRRSESREHALLYGFQSFLLAVGMEDYGDKVATMKIRQCNNKPAPTRTKAEIRQDTLLLQKLRILKIAEPIPKIRVIKAKPEQRLSSFLGCRAMNPMFLQPPPTPRRKPKRKAATQCRYNDDYCSDGGSDSEATSAKRSRHTTENSSLCLPQMQPALRLPDLPTLPGCNYTLQSSSHYPPPWEPVGDYNLSSYPTPPCRRPPGLIHAPDFKRSYLRLPRLQAWTPDVLEEIQYGRNSLVLC